MRLSTSVMAHPARAQEVGHLVHALDADVPVAWDNEGPAGREPDRIWRTARRGWELYDPGADWHLLLQDDAVPADGLLPAAQAALPHVPDDVVVSLYVGTGRPIPGVWYTVAAQADAARVSWIRMPMVLWGVALAVPTRVIPEMIAWCDRQRGIPDDMRVSRWARKTRRSGFYSWPALVDHPDDGSLTGHGRGRRARKFTGSADDWDPAGRVLDWSARRLAPVR